MVNVLASGSKGNAVIYGKSILVDCGVPFALIKPYLKEIQLILLTHEHGDHLNVATLKKIISERPALRVGCCEWLKDKLDFVKNLDIYQVGSLYDYGVVKISPIQLYHDVPNCGYRLFFDMMKIIHATDTAHLEGITASEYDVYAIEHNYDEDTVFESIKAIEAAGGYAHQRGSINSHLSDQQATEFIWENKGKKEPLIVRLHEHKD
jgi:L-ascorbate metabolism protein UlaG (beta-lactamase superfamily)